MAKSNGPCMSIRAHGEIAKTILFRYSKGRNIIQLKSKLPTLESEKQYIHRQDFKAAKDNWNSATEEIKQDYRDRAKERGITGYDLYIEEQSNNSWPFIFDYAIFDYTTL